MTIKASGPMMLSEVLAEYGASGPVMLSDLYRGKSIVRNNAAGNVSQNLSAQVPEIGGIKLSDFYGAAAAFHFTLTGQYNYGYEAHVVFGSDIATSWKKIFELAPGTLVGNFEGANYDIALLFHAAWGGSLDIINHGSIHGRGGGAYYSHAGGNAMHTVVGAGTPVRIWNYGDIRGGGGAGGAGGTGGQGGYGWVDTSYTARDPASGEHQARQNTEWAAEFFHNNLHIWWGGSRIYAVNRSDALSLTALTIGAYTYYRGSYFNQDGTWQSYGIVRTWWVSQGYNTAGGAGGAGGRGGYGRGHRVTNEGAGRNSGGVAGGANAGWGGWGGAGGAGGDWGQLGNAGEAGYTGAAGNAGAGYAGSAGSPGFAPGKALNWQGDVAFVVPGILSGAA